MQYLTHALQHVAFLPLLFITPTPSTTTTTVPKLFNSSTTLTQPHKQRATVSMADRGRPQPHQVQVHPNVHQQHRHDVGGGVKSLLPQKGPSTGQVLAVVTLLPVTGTLLGLAALALVGSIIGLAVAAPLFVIFSPVLVPAAILVAGAVTAFLTSGAFGLTGLSSLTWVLNSFRQATGQEPLEYAKQRMQEGTVYVGEKTKQVGETIKSTAQEGVTTTGRTA